MKHGWSSSDHIGEEEWKKIWSRYCDGGRGRDLGVSVNCLGLESKRGGKNVFSVLADRQRKDQNSNLSDLGTSKDVIAFGVLT